MAIAFIFTTISFCQLKFREKKCSVHESVISKWRFYELKLVKISFWISEFVEMFAQSQLYKNEEVLQYRREKKNILESRRKKSEMLTDNGSMLNRLEWNLKPEINQNRF